MGDCTKTLVTANVVEAVVITSTAPHVVVSCGMQGVAGSSNITDAHIADVVRQTIHADSATDGVAVDGTGNIRLTIGTLPALP